MTRKAKNSVIIEVLEAKLKDPEPQVRKQAIFSLGRIRTEKSRKLLRFLAENDPDFKVRRTALICLSQIGEEADLPWWEKRFYQDKANAVFVIWAICRIGGETTKRFLLQILEKPALYGSHILCKKGDQKTKLTALGALAKNKSLLTAQELEKLYNNYVQLALVIFRKARKDQAMHQRLDKIFAWIH